MKDVVIMFVKIANHYLQLYRSLDSQISKNLIDGGFVTRPAKSNGLWCFTLIPTILILYNWVYVVPPIYSISAFVSIGLLIYSVLFIVFLLVSCLVLREPIYEGCLASCLVPSVLYIILYKDLIFTLLIIFSPIFLYSTCLRKCLSYPKTFTIGEAMIVSQAIAVGAGTVMAKVLYWTEYGEDEEIMYFNVISYTVLSTVGLLVTALYMMKNKQKDLGTLVKLLIVAALYALLVLHSTLGPFCVMRIFQLLFLRKVRLQLISFWVLLVMLAVIVLCCRTKTAVKANTVTRKSFHVLGSLVFLSGILVDLPLIKLASAVGFGLIVLVEALRKSNIEPISSNLQAAFNVYCDEKDCGSFAMTPMYLFCGLASPLFVVPPSATKIELLTGVLSIGIGDTAASWFGSKYGRHKWADSKRTLEGTASNILSQVATVSALIYFGWLTETQTLLRTAIAAIAVALVEAKTDQVDNLVLPLVMVLVYQATSFMS